MRSKGSRPFSLLRGRDGQVRGVHREVKKARAPEPRAEAPGFSFSLPSAGETDKYEEYEKRDVSRQRPRRSASDEEYEKRDPEEARAEAAAKAEKEAAAAARRRLPPRLRQSERRRR